MNVYANFARRNHCQRLSNICQAKKNGVLKTHSIPRAPLTDKYSRTHICPTIRSTQSHRRKTYGSRFLIFASSIIFSRFFLPFCYFIVSLLFLLCFQKVAASFAEKNYNLFAFRCCQLRCCTAKVFIALRCAVELAREFNSSPSTPQSYLHPTTFQLQ